MFKYFRPITFFIATKIVPARCMHFPCVDVAVVAMSCDRRRCGSCKWFGLHTLVQELEHWIGHGRCRGVVAFCNSIGCQGRGTAGTCCGVPYQSRHHCLRKSRIVVLYNESTKMKFTKNDERINTNCWQEAWNPATI
jgi:hypothetical protein